MSKDLVSALVAWLPLVLLLGVVIAFGRSSSKKYDRHVADVTKINAELVAVNRAMAQTLVEIRTLLQTGKS